MRRSTRTMLTTGVAALSVGALVTTPSLPPEALRTVLGVRPVTLSTEITQPTSGASVTRVSEAELETALALIEQLAPVADGRLVTVGLDGDDGPGAATVAPARSGDAAAATGEVPGDPAAAQAIEDPAPLNAASDLIDGVYSFTRYWANYVSLELGPWLINWVPFGYLISDQIYIWYPDFVLPVVDSFVYDFLDPVVNNPLDLGVWIDGIGDIINTAVTGVYNGIVSEIDYVLSFGWFPIPLPPLPDFPLPGLTSDSTVATAAPAIGDLGAQVTDADEVAEDSPVGEGAGAEEAGEESADAPAQEDPAETAVDDVEAPTEPKRQEAPELPIDQDDESTEVDEGTEVEDEADEPAAEVSEDASDSATDEPETDDADGADDGDTASDSGEQSGTDKSDTDSSESDD